jgi:hypothetical protein
MLHALGSLRRRPLNVTNNMDLGNKKLTIVTKTTLIVVQTS